MEKYTVTWLEKHVQEIQAPNEKRAVERALERAGESSLVSIYQAKATKN